MKRSSNTPPDDGTTVLLAGFDGGTADGLRDLDARVLAAPTAATALELLDNQRIAVLCTGGRLRGPEARGLLQDARCRSRQLGTVNVVLAAGPEPELFRSFIDEDELYYLSQEVPPRIEIQHILGSAVAHHRRPDRREVETEGEMARWQSALELVRGLYRETASRETVSRQSASRTADGDKAIERAVGLTSRAVEQLTAADSAECLIYDPDEQVLWTRRMETGEERTESAATGLVSFVARTGVEVDLEAVGEDPRYDPEADNDGGPRDQRLLAVPVTSAGHRRLAVLVALRDAVRPPFSGRDLESLRFLAEQVAPIFDRLALQEHIDELSARRHGVFGTEAGAFFRPQALEHHQGGSRDHGRVLELSPSWTPWVYRLLLAVVFGTLIYSLAGRVSEYATGRAVVRIDDRTEVSAALAGTVNVVTVEPGETVVAGQVLARLDGTQELAELERLRSEFDLGLLDRLRNPADRSGARTLSALRAQKQLAEARLEARSIRAPHPGMVSDLRARPGQYLQPGQAILTLAGERAGRSVTALFPGHYRPLIQPGMNLRLELQGYRFAAQELTVERVGDEIVGPGEARRFLGHGIGDAVALSGPVIFVHARLPGHSFESDGRRHEFHDGMQGTAEIKVRDDRILSTLIPGLKALSREAAP